LAAKFSVGDWTVFPDLNTLERHGQSVRLQPKVMHVLVAWPTPPAKRSRKNRFLPVSGRELLVSDDAPFVHSRVFQRSGVILCVAIEVLQCRTVGQGNHRRSRFRSARVPSSTSLGRRCDRRRGPLRYPAMACAICPPRQILSSKGIVDPLTRLRRCRHSLLLEQEIRP
jgi:hypothetical protein